MRNLLIILCLLLSACAGLYAETSSFNLNYAKAQQYQQEERFELAKQYYLLALAAATHNESVQTIEQKLFAVERQIITLR